MSVSKVSNRWLNRTYKVIAILLVIFAVLISSLRLFLPYAHKYRQDVQSYINNTYGSHVVIGNLNMGWLSSGPSFVAENISLLQTDGAEVYIQKFDVNVDFWRSLKHRTIVTKDFSLTGVKILFDKQIFADNTAAANDQALIDNVSELFLQQISRFSIQDSQIIYRGDKGERTFVISELHWANNGLTHKAKGNVILDGITSNNLQLNVDVRGETISDMAGTVYLQANQLNITPWLDKVFAIKDENTHSSINFDAWLTIADGAAKKLQVKLGQNQMAWQHDKQIKTLNVNNGDIVFDHLNSSNKFSIYSNNLAIRTDAQDWQPVHFELNSSDQVTTTYISQIDLAGVADLMPLFSEHNSVNTLLADIELNGQIQDTYITTVDKKMSIVGQFNQVATQYDQGIPGVSLLQGQFAYQNEKLLIDISGLDGQLDFKQHFNAPIDYEKISASLLASKRETGWHISSQDIHFDSPNLKLTAEFGLIIEEGKEPELSLLAGLRDVNVVDAPSYYPNQLMGDDLVSYLNRSLKKGIARQASVLVNGPISSFPYLNNEGIFNVNAELTDASFIFDEKWPAIQHFSANLNFTNNSMLITGRGGSLNGLDVSGVTAEIDNLSNDQVLVVDATLESAAPELVANLMLTSPLNESVGAVLERLQIENPVEGTFNLVLPLNNVDEAIAKGNIVFNNNSMNITNPAMHFSKLNGELSFKNELLEANDVSLEWRGMPLIVDVKGQQHPIHYDTSITLTALWPEQTWLSQLPDQMQMYGSGDLAWQGNLVFNNFRDGSFNYNLSLDSNLIETTLDLPAPYGKPNQETLKVTIAVNGNLEQSTVDAQLGDELSFYGKLEHEKAAFVQSHLILGSEPMFLPVEGFYITADLDEAKFSQWQPFLIDLLNSIEEGKKSQKGLALLPQPERVRGDIEKLDVYGEALNGFSFNLQDQESWWLLSLSSKEARADIKFYPDWLIQGIDISADFIRIAPNKELFANESLKESEHIEAFSIDTAWNNQLFSNLPPMQFSCGECRYGNLNLGKVDFKVGRPELGKLTLENFVAKRKHNKLHLNGVWTKQSEQSITHLLGDYVTNDIEREFEQLGVTSTVADSGLDATFDLQWLGGPHDFAFTNFNGDVKAELDEGVLKEVPDQARAFSLLSLQSLVRKLKFDFRDIFSDGMFYSEIKGDYHIQNGVIYTKNTFMKGAAGDLSVKGNTDLNSKDLDYHMTYQPNVTSSLPAIAWIATLNPVTFLAGVAIDGVITSQVPVEYKFALTGNIEEPDFKQIDKKTKHISVGRDSPPQIVENLPVEQPELEIQGVLNPETGLIEPIEKAPPDRHNG